MLANVRLLASCATVFAALALTTKDGTARPLQPPAARDDIAEVVKMLRQKKVDRAALAKKVAAIKKNNEDLNDLMAIYKPTKLSGIGYNPARMGPGDGIEKRIYDLGTKKELTKAQMAEEKDHIVRAAYLNLAMFEITKAYTPTNPAGIRLAVGWGGHNGEVKAGSEEALAAVAANDPAALKKAMRRIGSGCNGCHSSFRSPPLDKDLADLVQLLRDGKVAMAQLAVAAVRKNRPLEDIMAKVYKPTKLSGIGYNPAKMGPNDGIEKRIYDLGRKKELTKAELAAEKDLLLRAAYYNLAIVEITRGYAPAKPKAGEWNKHNGEVASGTKDMIDAVKANDPKALKKAMGKIGAGCNGCHATFR